MEIILSSENPKYLEAKYMNCKISITLDDYFKINTDIRPGNYDGRKIIYIHDFDCDMPGEKGNGRKLLSMVLDHIQKTYFKGQDVVVSLLAASKERKDSAGHTFSSDNAKLVQYYTKLGFTQIDQSGLMTGGLNQIFMKCMLMNGGRMGRMGRMSKTKRRQIRKKKSRKKHF